MDFCPTRAAHRPKDGSLSLRLLRKRDRTEDLRHNGRVRCRYYLIGLSRGLLGKHMLDAGHGQFLHCVLPWVAFIAVCKKIEYTFAAGDRSR